MQKFIYREDDIPKIIPSFRRMVQRIHPDFDETRDYILWIVADFWNASPIHAPHGFIQLTDGKVPWDVEQSLGFDIDTNIWTPYPNKNIRQIGTVKQKKAYGVPIVLPLEELLELKKIIIHWDMVVETCKSGKSARIAWLNSIYNVSFDTSNSDKNHWFTLSRQDMLYDKRHSEDINDYYDQIKVDRKDIPISSEGSPWTRGHINYIRSIHPEIDPIPMEIFNYTKDIVLSAEKYPDILCEPSFGFDCQ